jgi:DNA-binding winged helix-turn-helix (wHTH) protein
VSTLPRYRFGDLVVSPRQRVLVRAGREVPLIPRYFDLLVLLLSRRDEAVHRSAVFASVWSDVVVSDGALTQAIRALRRALGDDPREPRFIRTISRHGYRFVGAGVIEEPDEGPAGEADATVEIQRGDAIAGDLPSPVQPAVPEQLADDDVDRWLERLCSTSLTEDERREAAERLHVTGTARALARLGSRPGAAAGRALLRDARWELPGAGPVPLWRDGGSAHAVAALVGWRVKRAWRQAGRRWATATLGAAVAGALTGAAGGLGLTVMPGTTTPLTAAAVLAALGALAGASGGFGIGAGMSGAEALARSGRAWAIIAGGAAGGALVGWAGRLLVRWTLDALFGVTLDLGGPLEGLVLGAAAGLGYAWATRDLEGGGMAAPRGRARLRVATVVAGACAAAALALGAAGRPMVGGLINGIAEATRQSQLSFTPLARAIGEHDFGPVTASAVGALEGAAFGFGLTLGLARRPRRG